MAGDYGSASARSHTDSENLPVSGGLSGMTSWLIQRISATFLGIYILIFMLALIVSGGWNYAEWQSLMSAKPMIAATVLFYFSVLLHAWVGIRDVIMDYIHPLAIRLLVLSLIGATLLLFAFWSFVILGRLL